MHRDIPGSGNGLIDDLIAYKKKKQHNEKILEARNQSINSTQFYLKKQPIISHREAQFRNTTYIQEQKELAKNNKLLYNNMLSISSKQNSFENPLSDLSEKMTYSMMNNRRIKMQEIEKANIGFLKRLENVTSNINFSAHMEKRT